MAAAKSIGCKPNDIAINQSTIHRKIIFIRQQVSDNIMTSFKPDCPLTYSTMGW